jgi:hypothetical protein
MHCAPVASDVRQLVVSAFLHLGMSEGAEPRETVLIRDGLYCARRFDVESGHAIWFMEEEQIKLFRADGRLVHVIEPIVTPTMLTRQAA